jgi:hypothetical protein
VTAEDDPGAAREGRPSHLRAKPSLKTELLLQVALLAAGALVLAIVSALLVPLLGGGWLGAGLLALLVVADLLILITFGRYLLTRFVLGPLDALVAATEAVAAGELDRRAPEAATEELDRLAASVNRMTDRVLDARGALVRAEKLASVGRLAAGIAHEVGNPLSAIANYVEVLRRRGVDGEVVAAITRETGRIDAIVRSLLDYARLRESRREPVALEEIARDATQLLEAQGLLRRVTVTLEADRETPPILGDRTALEQVVVNLLLNAVDAAGEGGRVGVSVVPGLLGDADGPARRSDPTRATPERRERRSGRHLPGVPDGTRVARLIVGDSGPGVAAELVGRIFDPFFTTKEPGRGTGLGLAIVQRLIEDHGGRVDVARAREGGAAFVVTLPPAPAGP